MNVDDPAARAGPEDDVAPVDDVVEECKKDKVGDDGSDATDRRAAFPIAMETFSENEIEEEERGWTLDWGVIQLCHG